MTISPRWIAAIVAFTALSMASACDGALRTGDAPKEGFSLEVFAGQGEQVYLVRHADGRQVAARASGGASSLIPPAEAQTLIGVRRQAVGDPGDPGESDVSIDAPGFSLAVADSGGGPDDRARIEINAGGARVSVDAQGGETNGRALVSIAGADDDAARNFINDADKLSPETKAEMLRRLGL